MGLAIDREDFSAHEYDAFSARLYECLQALRRQMSIPGFGQAKQQIGAELELYIVGQNGDVLPINQALIARTFSKNYTVELNKFNVEINLDPVPMSANAFSQMQASMDLAIGKLRFAAREFDANIVPVGILPTLRSEHLSSQYMTDFTRYRALSKNLFKMRGEDFRVNICGEESLELSCDHVALEGANTSFQYHLMVEPDEFANVFNAVQLTTSLVVAVAANSPVLLGRLLWDETRIALFKQSIDSRLRDTVEWRQPSRVSFGHGWVRDDAWELFAETVALYPPLFPILADENPMFRVDSGLTPQLDELCLHMGTTWPWNRAVYSGAGTGHIRIEMRALPAGPTNKDMVANIAFATGLAIGLKGSIKDLLAIMPFRFAEYNFYRAAQDGLDASVVWSDRAQHQPVEMPIRDVILQMLPVAEQGLKELGVADAEIHYYLTLIESRVLNNQTGAIWQRKMLRSLEQKSNRVEACQALLHQYIRQQVGNEPIAQWSLPR